MLKGKTKIELIDTRNGHIDTYEDTNMFTNGIQELLSYTSVLDNNKFQSNINSSGQAVSNYNGVLGNDEYPTINYFTGGLLLLQDYISEDATTISIPANNKVIGRACLENNESTQTGSRNGSLISKEFINETVENAKYGKKYKYVWEFNETQANGTISCVSLTTPKGATSAPLDSDETITHPNKYPYKHNNFKCVCDGRGHASNNMMQSYGNKDGGYREKYLGEKLIAFVDGTNNCYYCFSDGENSFTKNNSSSNSSMQQVFNCWKNNKKIILHKYRFPYNNFSIFDDRRELSIGSVGIQPVDKMLEEIIIDIPDSINLNNINMNKYYSNYCSTRMSVCNNDNYLYILLSNYAKSQGKIIGVGSDKQVREQITTANGLNDFITFNCKDTNNFLYLMKIDLSDFSIEAKDLSSVETKICSWIGNAVDDYYSTAESGNNGTCPTPNNNMNLLNDIYVFDDKLYFFKKDNINTTNHTFDLVLCYMDINNTSVINNVQYNEQDIIINCAVYEGDDKEPFNLINTNRRFCGKYLNKYFSLGVPFVSMISNGNNLFVTFIENKKTYLVNGSTAYLLNENDNDLFNIKIKENLDTEIYPQDSINPRDDETRYDSQYWETGHHSISFVYTPSAEKLFYIIGGNGRILKVKDKETKMTTKTLSDSGILYSKGATFNFIKEAYPEWGCYDILRDSTPLITINNLENQIEKKPYQKMRVTYTITEV